MAPSLRVLGLSLALLKLLKLKENSQKFKRRRRTEYVAKINLDRKLESMANYSIALRREENQCQSTSLRQKNFYRMPAKMFELLLSKLEVSLVHPKTHRLPILPDARLTMTLRFLGGDKPSSIAHNFRSNKCTVLKIVYETLDVIYNTLKKEFLAKPSEAMWRRVAQDFELKWQYPMCIGAIDGKHIQIQRPPNSSSLFFNRKETYSMVLMAIVDANYKCLYFDYGGSGRNSDAGLFKNSHLNQSIQAGTAKLPGLGLLPGTSNEMVNFYLVGDEGFPMSTTLMRPYPGRGCFAMNTDERIFNYRLSRARRISENFFGILRARFQIYNGPIACDPDKVDKIVRASVVLHNFLMENSRSYGELNPADIPQINNDGNFMNENLPANFGSNRHSRDAQIMRDRLKNYFMSPEGSVSWQEEAMKQQ